MLSTSNFKTIEGIATYDYFIGFIDWGDETTLTEQEFDYNSEPFKLGFDSTITHRYSRPGIYEIKGKMFRVGSMGETTVSEMVEGCKRMISCFRDFGIELPEVKVESYFE